MKSMFLKEDLPKAEKEMDCYLYCFNLATDSALEGDFKKAIAYHDNIVRSLKALQEMKENKEKVEELKGMLKQLEGKTMKLDLSIFLSDPNEK